MDKTNEPVSKETMKRIAKGNFYKIPHLQKAINDWENIEDKNGTKTYEDLREYIIAKDLESKNNKTALQSIGICNIARCSNADINAINLKMEALDNALVKIAQQQ